MTCISDCVHLANWPPGPALVACVTMLPVPVWVQVGTHGEPCRAPCPEANKDLDSHCVITKQLSRAVTRP